MGDRLGVVVAGGQGRRLERGVPKALVSLAGVTLLERALQTLRPLCDRLLVVAPEGFPLPEGLAGRVSDVPGAEGPLAGVVAGLNAHPYSLAFVLGVDFPMLRPALLEALAARLEGHPAVLPAPHGVPQPIAAVYGPGAARALEATLETGERSITVAVWKLRPRLFDDGEIEAIEGSFENFLNLNTPADFTRIESLLGVRARHGDAA